MLRTHDYSPPASPKGEQPCSPPDMAGFHPAESAGSAVSIPAYLKHASHVLRSGHPSSTGLMHRGCQANAMHLLVTAGWICALCDHEIEDVVPPLSCCSQSG